MSQPAQCAKCKISERICRDPENGRGPEFCPTVNLPEIAARTAEEYKKPDVKAFAKAAAEQEGAGYAGRDLDPPQPTACKPRIQEICEFAHRMNYKRLGIAFCAGLQREAGLVSNILEAQGFEVLSAVCKFGAAPKENLGVADEDKIKPGGFESMCSPVGQAMVLNDAGSEFNVVVGLCVGHDSLFFKYSEAPVTVLIAKDRVSGHNPAGPLNTSGSYYARLTKPGFGGGVKI